MLQVLTLLAMEAPTKADGPESGESIRNAKVQVLNSIPPITMEECVLGQYEGYTDDPSIENKDSNTPTYVAIRCFVHTRECLLCVYLHRFHFFDLYHANVC